ncbi:hypothetical protein [Candidatus Tisiphia endosymbiont of Sialis lutaria]|uniref:hypothetical protein n=1 Tax=Candidatus Tisiphia endosymbiont of Sialis lutaria TaxID=2029164 RepID=UPI00312C6DAB
MQRLLGKKLTPHIIAIVIFMVYNISIYQCLQYSQKEQDKLALEMVQHNIITLLATDIETALNSNVFDKTFFILKKFTSQDSNQILNQSGLVNFIGSNNSFLYVNNFQDMLVFDLQNLKETIIKILPIYLIYQIEINANDIATNNIDNNDYLTKRHCKINNINLLIKLGIRPNSDYYLNNVSKLYKCLYLNIAISFVICSIILYIYLQRKQRFTYNIEQLEDNLFAANKLNNALILHKKSSRNLNAFFIKKATEKYIRQQLELDSNQRIKMDRVAPSNYLFPICFTNHTQAEINIKELINYLENYFAEHFLDIAIKYEYKTDKLIVDCGQHVLYQIIFSLMYNLIHFMEDQSSLPKTLIVTFNVNNIIISYDSFLLTEQMMINLSNSMLLEIIDPFLLSCNKIFQSLREHGLNYKIFSKNKINIITITLRRTVIINKEKGKVISFAKYTPNK